MPRYFFHFTNGRQKFTDSDWRRVARHCGYATTRNRANSPVARRNAGRNWLGWKIIAADNVGNTVYEIGFDFASLDDPEMRQRDFAQSLRLTRHE